MPGNLHSYHRQELGHSQQRVQCRTLLRAAAFYARKGPPMINSLTQWMKRRSKFMVLHSGWVIIGWFSVRITLFLQIVYQTRQAIYWKYFIEPEYITSAWNPNFILLSFTKNNFTGNMFENQLKQKNSVFALRNCMGWDHQVSESALAPSRVSISISTSGSTSTSTSISKSAVQASANQRWPNWPTRHPRVIQVDW